MKWRLLCLIPICLAVSSLTRGQKPSEDGLIKPLVQASKGDYAEARRTFRTRLTREMKPPGDDETLTLPKGATEITFPSGGRSLKAWVNAPRTPSEEKRPAVLFLHGGFSFGNADWDMAKPYRDAGFVVMAPRLRGENGQEGAFSLFYDEVDDVVAAAEYLAQQPFVDAAHIHVAGHSVGGTLAMLAAITSRRFSSAVSFSGSPDQAIFCRYGIPPEQIPFDTSDAREVQMRSPLAFSGSFKCPARLYFGTREPHFKLSTLATAQGARRRRLDVQAVEIEGGHFSAIPEAMGASIGFFHKH